MEGSAKPDNRFPNDQNVSDGTQRLFLEALADAIEDKIPNGVTQTQTLPNSGANVRLPSLSSLTYSIQPPRTTAPQDPLYGPKYKEYIAAYTAYCQAYQYAAAMAYQRAFTNTMPHAYPHPQQPNSSNTSVHPRDPRQAYQPIAIKPQDDPPFTGRYGHDDLVKAYSRPKIPANEQQSPTTPSSGASNDAHTSGGNNSDSESLADRDDVNDDEYSSDSIHFMTNDGSASPEPQPLSYHDTQKRAHKLAERRRRNEMKRLFEQLRDLLPDIPNFEKQKLSKWDVLSQAVSTIDVLLRKKAALISKKNYLAPRIAKSPPIDDSILISDENIDSCNVNIEQSVSDPSRQARSRKPCLDALAAIVDSP